MFDQISRTFKNCSRGEFIIFCVGDIPEISHRIQNTLKSVIFEF